MNLPVIEPVAKNGASAAAPYLYPELVFELADEAGTATLAAVVARFAVVGDVIRLQGDLGAGKSTFARYFIDALGYDGDVPSPTYTLVQTYATPRVNVAHVDCYRLENPAELDGLGLEDYRKHGIIVSEWSDKGGALLAQDQPDVLPYHINNPDNGGVLEVLFEPSSDIHTARKVTLTGSPAWQRRFGLMFASVPRGGSVANRQAMLDRQGLAGAQMEAFPGDWSGRSYARVTLANGSKHPLPAGQTQILMDSPPPWESTQEFVDVAAYYRSIGLHAPAIFAQDNAEGFLLLEDLGGERLLDLHERGGETLPWYRVAVEALVTMAKARPLATARTYLPRDWWIETTRFIDWYFPLATGRAATLAEREQFQQLWAPLFAHVLDGPQGTMLWDYQATNLMLLGDEPCLGNLGLIDFQDARTAPVAQDLAILLRDIRRNPDDQLEREMLDYAAKELRCDRAKLQKAVEIANLQHAVRIIGGLARAWLRDGKKGGAERFMARTWATAKQSFGCPELADLAGFIAPLEAPGLAKIAAKKAT